LGLLPQKQYKTRVALELYEANVNPLLGVDNVTMVSNLDLIRRVPLFTSLSDLHAEAMANAVVKRRYKRGELIVEQGKKSNSLYIVLAGRARVLTSHAGGREVILATMGQGDYIGEMSLIDDEPHSASVRAEMQTDVLLLSNTEFSRCMPDQGSVAYAVLRGLTERLRRADRNIQSLALMDVYGRVARVLLEAATPDINSQLVIREKISRQDIAKMVGASREMVSRVMKDLEQRGFIETLEHGSILIKDRLAVTV
jgi:CRP/FNR family transcriptional regulator, cyclic AMP receptor protein